MNTDIEKLIEYIEDRPNVYLGNSNPNLDLLSAFLAGLEMAESGLKSNQLFPEGFREFVIDYYSMTSIAGSRSALMLIEFQEGKENAYKAFFRLRKEFLESS